MTANTLSRRQALLGVGAIAGGLSVGERLQLPRAHAKAPFAKDQAPYFYRFAHGNMQATIVSDGTLPLGEPFGFIPWRHQGRNRQDADRQFSVVGQRRP
jgi:hypothetical protein